jgi:hypothetical protein
VNTHIDVLSLERYMLIKERKIGYGTKV